MTGRRPQIEVAVALPWGTGPDEVREVLADHPPFGDVSPEQLRKVRAPVPLRLDPQGGVHALVGRELLRFDAGGGVELRTPVPALRDFAIDGRGGIYLLEADGPVARVDPGGREIWRSRRDADRLLAGGGRLHLHSRRDPTRLVDLDADSGEPIGEHLLSTPASHLFGPVSGKVLRVAYFAPQRRRGLSLFDVQSGEETVRPGGHEMYRWLLQPFGADAELCCYVYDRPAMRRISPRGEEVASLELEEVLVRPGDGAIFSSWQDGRLRHLQRHGAAPRRRQVEAAGGALIAIDAEDRLLVLSGEAPGDAGTLQVIDLEGRVVDQRSPPPDLLERESRLHGPETWAADSAGRVYLPLSDPAGFKVVRVTF